VAAASGCVVQVSNIVVASEQRGAAVAGGYAIEAKHSRARLFFVRGVDGSEQTRGSEGEAASVHPDALTRALLFSI
jgi:hypothetical protein